MESNRRGFFREDALANHANKRLHTVVPKLDHPRLLIVLWLIVAMSIAAFSLFILFQRVPLNVSGIGHLVQECSKEKAIVVLLSKSNKGRRLSDIDTGSEVMLTDGVSNYDAVLIESTPQLRECISNSPLNKEISKQQVEYRIAEAPKNENESVKFAYYVEFEQVYIYEWLSNISNAA